MTIRADIVKMYSQAAGEQHINAQQFDFTLLRPEGNVSLEGVMTSVEWVDEGADMLVNALPMLHGSATVAQPDEKFKLSDGNRIRCDLRWGTKLTHLWEMRIQQPALQGSDGTWTLTLYDDLWLLGQSEDDFRYVAGKRKRHNGWRYDEIVADVCRRYHVPAGQMVRGKRRIKHMSDTGVSPLYLIRRAVEAEVAWTGVPLVISWRWSETKKAFGLHVLPLRRNPLLYVLSDQITEAQLEWDRRGDMATVLVARGHSKHGKKRHKLHTTVHSTAAIKEFGYLRKQQVYNGAVDGLGELRDKAKYKLASRLKPWRKIEITHPGIALVRRGDAMRVEIPSAGYKGTNGVVFVQSATHTLSGGDYTMDLTMSFVDPEDPERLRKQKNTAARARKRAAKKGS